MPLQVFVVEDHPLMIRVIRQMLDAQHDLHVCGTAGSAEEALEQLEDCEAEIVLIDVALPHMTGIELVHALAGRRYGVPCVLFSGYDEESLVRRGLAAGARGYVLKDDAAELTDAVRRVVGGDVYLSRRVRRTV